MSLLSPSPKWPHWPVYVYIWCKTLFLCRKLTCGFLLISVFTFLCCNQYKAREILNKVSKSVGLAHIFPDELGDGAGQHEAGDSAAQDVEDGVHDAGAGGGAHWRTKGTAERAGGGPTAAAYLRSRNQEERKSYVQ